jgi:hypothetical protein
MMTQTTPWSIERESVPIGSGLFEGDPLRLNPEWAERFEVILRNLERTASEDALAMAIASSLPTTRSNGLLTLALNCRLCLSATASSCGADVAEDPEASIASAPPSRHPTSWEGVHSNWKWELTVKLPVPMRLDTRNSNPVVEVNKSAAWTVK